MSTTKINDDVNNENEIGINNIVTTTTTIFPADNFSQYDSCSSDDEDDTSNENNDNVNTNRKRVNNYETKKTENSDNENNKRINTVEKRPRKRVRFADDIIKGNGTSATANDNENDNNKSVDDDDKDENAQVDLDAELDAFERSLDSTIPQLQPSSLSRDLDIAEEDEEEREERFQREDEQLAELEHLEDEEFQKGLEKSVQELRRKLAATKQTKS